MDPRVKPAGDERFGDYKNLRRHDPLGLFGLMAGS